MAQEVGRGMISVAKVKMLLTTTIIYRILQSSFHHCDVGKKGQKLSYPLTPPSQFLSLYVYKHDTDQFCEVSAPSNIAVVIACHK